MNNGSSLVPTVAGVAASGGTAAAIATASNGIGLVSLSASGTLTTVAISPIVATVAIPLAVLGGAFAFGYWYFKDKD